MYKVKDKIYLMRKNILLTKIINENARVEGKEED